MRIGHRHRVGAQGHHLGIVEIVAKDDCLGRLQASALEERSQRAALIDARGLDVDPAGAGVNDAQVCARQRREALPEHAAGIGVVDGHFAEAHGRKRIERQVLAARKVVAHRLEVRRIGIVNPRAGGPAEDRGGPGHAPSGGDHLGKEVHRREVLEEGLARTPEQRQGAILGNHIQRQPQFGELRLKVGQLPAAGDGPANSARGQTAHNGRKVRR